MGPDIICKFASDIVLQESQYVKKPHHVFDEICQSKQWIYDDSLGIVCVGRPNLHNEEFLLGSNRSIVACVNLVLRHRNVVFVVCIYFVFFSARRLSVGDDGFVRPPRRFQCG